MILRTLLFCLLALSSFSAFAQTRTLTEEQLEVQKRQEYRESINLDYSVPDYNVKKPDEKVMGWRLAKILMSLERNYTQVSYHHNLCQIRNEQMGEIKYNYLHIDKISILNIQKKDSVITIKINTLSKKDKQKITFDIVLTFVNSLSEDMTANQLFSDLARYIKEDEE